MPSSDDHRKKAEHNERVGERLAADQTYDWAVTTIFYAANQDVQALIKLRGWKVRHGRRWRAPKNHKERDQIVHDHCDTLETDYRTLKNLSEAARYDAESMTDREFREAKRLLARIRAEIAKL